LLPCCLIGPVVGKALALRASGPVLVGAEFVLLVAAALWWLVLEWKRRAEQAEGNTAYEEEQRERRRLAREQLEAWERKPAATVAAAQRQYEAALREWDQRVSSTRQEADRRRAAAWAAAQAVAAAESGWAGRAAALCGEFDRTRGELAALRDSHVELARRLAAEQQHLLAWAQEFQRVAYLQQQFIDAASIPDIGLTRKATLASFGIESAYDVTEGEVRAIPGFGEKLTARLLAWRAGVEAQFRFDPAVGVPEPERRAVEFKYFQARQPIEARLADGERELAEIARRARAEFEGFKQRIGALLVALERTSADLAVIPTGI
jgi:DNA-binding helix-hairpin-helix protein with protein kinase domain